MEASFPCELSSNFGSGGMNVARTAIAIPCAANTAANTAPDHGNPACHMSHHFHHLREICRGRASRSANPGLILVRSRVVLILVRLGVVASVLGCMHGSMNTSRARGSDSSAAGNILKLSCQKGINMAVALDLLRRVVPQDSREMRC